MEARLQRGDKPIKYLKYKPVSYEPKEVSEEHSERGGDRAVEKQTGFNLQRVMEKERGIIIVGGGGPASSKINKEQSFDGETRFNIEIESFEAK